MLGTPIWAGLKPLNLHTYILAMIAVEEAAQDVAQTSRLTLILGHQDDMVVIPIDLSS